MQEKPIKTFEVKHYSEEVNSSIAVELAEAIDGFPESDVLRLVLKLTPEKLNLIGDRLNRIGYLWNHFGAIENPELTNNLIEAINKLSNETDESEIQKLIEYMIHQIDLDI